MKALILGGDSLIGKALRDTLGQDCFYTSRRSEKSCIYFNLLDPDFTVFQSYLKDLDVVYFTAAVTRLADCQQDSQKSSVVNVENTINAIEYFTSFGIYCVFLSSTEVFSRSSPNCCEHSKTHPLSIYGKQKNQVEDYIRTSSHKHACIIRMNKIWDGESSIFFSWYTSISRSLKPLVYGQKRVAPISLSTAVRYLISIRHLKPLGVLHLTTDHDVSYANLAKYFTELNLVAFPEGFDWAGPEKYSADSAVFLLSSRSESKVCAVDQELDIIKRDFIEFLNNFLTSAEN